MIKQPGSNYKWYILFLGTITHILVVAAPRLCMPVLFEEISNDLGLTLVQIGTVWGLVGLPTTFVAFASGLLVDRHGARKTLALTCLLVGIVGALRGISGGFTSLAIYSFLFGLFSVPIAFTTHKAAGQWFPESQLGLANGILAMGMGVGTTLGSMISATVLSPWLGGWKNIMFAYGAVNILICLLWVRTRGQTVTVAAAPPTEKTSFRQALAHVTRIKSLWLIALSNVFITGCKIGVNGYLPLYLRTFGWTAVGADGALSAMSFASVVGVIPLSILSDRLGRRKVIIYAAIIVQVVGTGLLAFCRGPEVWPIVIINGLVLEGMAAVMITMVMETKGIGTKYAATALGISWTAGGLGSFITPTLGSALAEIQPHYAFIFWALMGVVSLLMFVFVEETGWKKKSAIVEEVSL